MIFVSGWSAFIDSQGIPSFVPSAKVRRVCAESKAEDEQCLVSDIR